MHTYTKRFHLVNFIVASCILTGLFCLSSWVQAELKKGNPIEVGNVNWSRDFKSALSASKINGKSLFLLFQEVPGCIGCRNFGQNVLTHPLLVEQAAKEQCAQAVYVEKNTSFDERRLPVKDLDLNNYRTASRSDQKKHLQGWLRLHKNLNLIPMQMMKLNSLMQDNMDEALSWLSPRQSRMLSVCR